MDTESQYSIFWNEVGKKYHPEYEEFGKIIKGQTLQQIYSRHFDGLERAVDRYRREAGDKLVWCRKYPLMNPMDGTGAGGHPTAATHRAMARTLADWIRTLGGPDEENHA